MRTCWFCDCTLSEERGRRSYGENHHAPIPARHGGDKTVPVCVTCHDLADRTNLSDLPNVSVAILGLWDIANRDQRLALWHFHSFLMDSVGWGDIVDRDFQFDSSERAA